MAINFVNNPKVGDNVKIEIGNSSDLQIYHDGNSKIETSTGSAGDLYIKSQGSGHDLYLQATDDVFIRPQGGENGIKVIGNGTVALYHNNAKKIETTTVGVKVTGNIVSETTSGNSGIKVITANTAEGFLAFGDAQDNSMGGIAYNNSTNTLSIDANNAERITINSSGFVGVGTTLPGAPLEVKSSELNHLTLYRPSNTAEGNAGGMKFDGNDSDSNQQTYAKIESFTDDATASSHAGKLTFSIAKGADGITSAMTIEKDAQVSLSQYGQGSYTGTAAYTLQVDSAGNIIEGSTTGGGTVTGSGAATRVAFWSGTTALDSNANLYWDNSNDRLGIGTTAPAYKLDVNGSSAAGIRLTTDGFTGLDLVSPRTSGNLGGLRWKQDIDANQTSEFLGLHGGGFDWKTGNGSSAPTIKMSMLLNGNLGIGTTSPDARLEVVASALTNVDIAHFSNSNGSQKAKFSLDGASNGVLTLRDASNNNDVKITTSGDSYFNGGSVGIGTTSPNTKLELLSTAANADRTIPHNILTITAESGNLPYTGFGGAIIFKNRNYSYGLLNSARIRSVIDSDSSSNRGAGLAFDVTNSSQTYNTSLFLKYNGSVGIGTTSPHNDAAGLSIAAASSTDQLYLERTGSATGRYYLGAASNSFYIVDDAQSSTRMTIDSSGNVGVGTSSPSLNTAYDRVLHIHSTLGSLVKLTDDTSGSAIGDGTELLNYGNDTFLINRDAGAIIFHNNGSTRMRISDAGDVGINETSPSAISSNATTLTIKGKVATKAGALLLKSSDNSVSAYMWPESVNGLTVGSLSNHNVRFLTNSTERMVITNAGVSYFLGRVGVQNSSPTSDLSVGSTTTNSGDIHLRTTKTAATLTPSNTAAGGFDIGVGWVSGGQGPITFSLGGSEKMRIDSAGDVLIGQTSFATNLSAYAQLEVSNATAGGIVINTQTAGASNYSRLMFTKGNASGNEGLIRYNTGDYHMAFWTNATESMRITSDGKVGIGVSSPSQKLEVRGNSLADKSLGIRTNYATQAGWEIATTVSSAAGFFGGNFISNGSSTENNIAYGENEKGQRGLIWRAQNNDAGSNADGGWNKTIQNLDNNMSYMSIVYVKRVGSTTNGTFYHGCSGTNTTNLNGSVNGNPYFRNFGISNLPQDVWCVSIGIIQSNRDSNTTNESIGGVYRLDTGQKIAAIGTAITYKMRAADNTQTHRTYLYYSTSDVAELNWSNPGFYAMDGSEPTLAEIVEGENTTGDYLPLSGGTLTGGLAGTTATFSGDISLGAGKKLQYSANSYITPENNVSGAEISTAGVFTVKTGTTPTEKMRVDGSGRVGIGTTAPSYKLTVNDSTVNGRGIQVVQSATSGTNYGIQGGAYGSGAIKNIGLSITAEGATTNDAAHFMGGNVGIGTASPSATLNVVNTSGGWSTYINNDVGSGTQSGLLLDAGSTSSDFSMYVRNAAATSDLFAIKGNGHVGIGTTAPSEKLHIGSGTVPATTLDGVLLTLGGGQYYQASDGTKTVFMGVDLSSYGIIGMFTNHDLGFRTNNTLRMLIDTSGNVGIGTTSPSYKLHVVGNVNIEGTNGYLRWNSGDIEITNAGSYAMAFKTYTGSALTEKMRITSSGNVGIGTTAPAQTLEIHNSNASDYTDFGLKGTGHKYVIGVGGASVADVNDKLYFYDNDNTAFRLVLDTSGNVGIGNTSPSAKLHVSGKGLFNAGDIGSDLNDKKFHLEVAGHRHHLDFKEVRTAQGVSDWKNTTFKLQMRVDSTNHQSIDFVSDSSYAEHIDIYTGNQLFNTRFDSSGKVGIGTTDPTHKLSIDGGKLSIQDADFSGVTPPGLTLGQLNNQYQAGIASGGHLTSKVVGSGNFYWYDDSNIRMYLSNGGNLGIGTTNAVYKLEVSGGAIAIRGHAPGNSLRFDSTDGTTSTSRNALYVDASNVFQIGNTNYAHNNITGGTYIYRNGNELLRLSTTGATGSPYISFYQSSTRRSYIQHDDVADNLNIASEYGGIRFLTGTNGTETEYMRINSSGNVGIGTTSPGGKLQVSGMALFETSLTNNDDHANSPISIRERGLVAATQTSNIYAPNLNFHWGGRVSNSLWMDDDGNLSYGPYSPTGVPSVSSLYGLSSGKLGAGTSVPATPLHAIGASDEIARIQTSSATGNPYISFYQSTTRRSFIQHDNTGDNINIGSEYGGIIFLTGTGGTETQKMVIQADGDVGIGVTNPVNKLQVGGKIYSSGDIQAAGQLQGSDLRLDASSSSQSDLSTPSGFIDITVGGSNYIIPYFDPE